MSAHTCSLGGGVIGASWTSLFLAGGKSVAVYDPAPQIERQVRDYIATAWPSLEELGLVVDGADPDALRRRMEFVYGKLEALEENLGHHLPGGWERGTLGSGRPAEARAAAFIAGVTP